MAKIKHKDNQTQSDVSKIPKQLKLQRIKAFRNRIIFGSIILIVILATISILLVMNSQISRNTLGMKLKIFEDKNRLFRLEVPLAWEISSNLIEILEFAQGLDRPNYAYLVYPKGTVIELKPEDIFKGTIITIAVFTKGLDQQERIYKYAGYLGGLTETPEKFYLEGLEKQGVKIIGTKYGYYSLVGGIPTAIVKTAGNIILFGGSAASDEEMRIIEDVFKSIKAP